MKRSAPILVLEDVRRAISPASARPTHVLTALGHFHGAGSVGAPLPPADRRQRRAHRGRFRDRRRPRRRARRRLGVRRLAARGARSGPRRRVLPSSGERQPGLRSPTTPSPWSGRPARPELLRCAAIAPSERSPAHAPPCLPACCAFERSARLRALHVDCRSTTERIRSVLPVPCGAARHRPLRGSATRRAGRAAGGRPASAAQAAPQQLDTVRVQGNYVNAVGTTDAASAGTVTSKLIESRPTLRPGRGARVRARRHRHAAQRRRQGQPVFPARLQPRPRHRLRDLRRRHAGQHADARPRPGLHRPQLADPRAGRSPSLPQGSVLRGRGRLLVGRVGAHRPLRRIAARRCVA